MVFKSEVFQVAKFNCLVGKRLICIAVSLPCRVLGSGKQNFPVMTRWLMGLLAKVFGRGMLMFLGFKGNMFMPKLDVLVPF